jgi:hypothetical protein
MSVSRIIKNHWPVIIALVIFWCGIILVLKVSLSRNQGHLNYALDDAYIHMAMAKNLALYGTWGVTKHSFSGSSSSLLWPILLALTYLLFGVNELSPLILNLVGGMLVCILAYVLLRKYALSSFLIVVCLLLMIFSTPLIPLVFSGMENILQIAISLLFVYLATQGLITQKTGTLEEKWLIILAPLLVMVRYEGLFLLLVVTVLFMIRHKYRYALLLGGAGILPAACYGVIAVFKGWYPLPNPVLQNGNLPDLSCINGVVKFLGGSGYNRIISTPHVLVLVLVLLVLFIFNYDKQGQLWAHAPVMSIIFIATTFLQMQFSRNEWFYRYEAYLVALGLFVIGVYLTESLAGKLERGIDRRALPRYIALGLIFLLLLPVLVLRGFESLKYTPLAISNIYEQQYQMGRFVRKFYQGRVIAANDIGAINFFADIKCLDLVGLASIEVARAKSRKEYTSQKIYELAKAEHTRIAMVYESWFRKDRRLPSQWIKVGEWMLPENVVCGDNTVSFYAVNPAEKDVLLANLRQFSSQLPRNVIQYGI